MDQPNNSTPVAAAPVQPVVPATPVAPAPTDGINLNPAKPIAHSSDGKKGGKMLWIIVLAIALIGIVGVGAYYVTQMNQSTPVATNTQPKAVNSEFANLENDVKGVQVQDFESDFSAVDQDLKGL